MYLYPNIGFLKRKLPSIIINELNFMCNKILLNLVLFIFLFIKLNLSKLASLSGKDLPRTLVLEKIVLNCLHLKLHY